PIDPCPRGDGDRQPDPRANPRSDPATAACALVSRHLAGTHAALAVVPRLVAGQRRILVVAAPPSRQSLTDSAARIWPAAQSCVSPLPTSAALATCASRRAM